MAPFSLSRANSSDMMEISELMYRNFRPWVMGRFMGLVSEEDIPKAADMYQRIMFEDPTDIWIKVIDNETGKIAAATNWQLYLGSEKVQKRTRSQPAEWLDEEWTKESRMLLEALNESKIRANPDPFLHLNICLTAAEYRRRGAGAMMMQWATDLADSLFVPCWVEASDLGAGLYSAFGYYEVGVVSFTEGPQL